ncbi:hypothetical protein SCUCBS95973_009045 [Sporothrix curviconia]|uniref:DNA excision repair protein n=1 Tax=Sporothrix curviconia TaxID=1260050 RepID=A0ABP0CT78_9PEZI
MAPRGVSARHEGIDIDDASTASELDDNFDLEPFKPAQAGPPLKGVKRRRSQTNSKDQTKDDDDEADEPDRPRKEARPDNVTRKIEWTDESDGEYERLKKRKRDAKGKERLGDAPDSTPGDEEEEDLTIPDYIRQRRREFDEKRAILKEAGLRLPPDYSDIYFSDDDADRRSHRRGTGRDNSLQQRPQFEGVVRPSRERKDIVLEYSAGVIPACIAQYLRDYQVAGVQFLHQLFVYQKGGILGDDMGLGKTVQVAAFLTAAFGKTGDERDDKRMRKVRRAAAGDDDRWYPRVLVVCPGSLIQNWRNELQRWGWWHVDLYHGAGKDDVLQSARAGRLEIMVTTYTTYKNHRDRINAVPWDAVVADECHTLKERTSGITNAMNEVNALCRIGLTGTAIQNKYDELWTLLNWTNPGRFGTLADWKRTISRPLTIGQSHDATLFQLSLARTTARKLVENLLPEFFLRRMKSLIAHQLPRKTDRVVFCPLTERQSAAYENFVNSNQVEHLRRVSEPCDCGLGRKRGWCCYRIVPDTNGATWFSLVFPTIQSLLKLANHLMLLVPSTDNVVATNSSDDDSDEAEDDNEGGKYETLAGLSWAELKKPASAAKAARDRHRRALAVLQLCVPDDWATLYHQRDSLVNLANPDFCGKWKVLRKLLRFWHENGDKVLVFSHNVRLLRILQHLFHNTSYSVSYLDGSLSYDERQRVVDDFNADPAQFVFLISTKAGGVGLNITSANKVVIFDPHWNPAYDLQAQDRAYRIGQVRDVDVFRLVSAGTIEEIVYARQIYKQQQANIGYSASTERRYFRGVQQDSARQGEIFGLNNLFTFHTDQVVLRDIVNKTNIAEAKAGVHLTAIDMEQAAADKDNEVLVKLEGANASSMASLLDDGEDRGDKKGKAADDNKESPETATRPKSDAIQAILASAGVEYTHDNGEVVGSSRVEAQLSRHAEILLAEEGAKDNDDNDGDEDDGDLDRGAGNTSRLSHRSVFEHSDNFDDDDFDDNDTNNGDNDDDNGHHNNTTLSDIERSMLMADTSAVFRSSASTRDLPLDLAMVARLEYNPPDDVMRRQFCTMARDAGFASATDFALVVEGWTPEQRRESLEGFYRKREQLVREQMEAARETESEGDGDGEGEMGREGGNGNVKSESASVPGGQEPTEPPEEVASLVVISEDVVERRERLVKMDKSDDDKKAAGKEDSRKKKEGNNDTKVKKRDDDNEDTKAMVRVKKNAEDEAKVKTETQMEEPRRPLIKREADIVAIPSTQATATQATQTQATQTQATQSVFSTASVRIKREGHAEDPMSIHDTPAAEENDNSRVVVLLSSSPVMAPAEEPNSVVQVPRVDLPEQLPLTRLIHNVIDDSDETDEP